jgi:hypothetical protein
MRTCSRNVGWFVLAILLTFGLVTDRLGAESLEVPSCNQFAGLCGDLDGDYKINISDAVYLVDYIFAGGPAPTQMWCGDCDVNGRVNLIDAVYLVGHIFAGGPSPCAGSGRSDYPETSPFQSCLEYQYDGVGLLQLTHVNTSFNCCPEEITVDVYLGGSTITIAEAEYFGPEGPCPCMCLFNLEFERGNVSPGIYTITVEEPNIYPDDEPLIFTVDLTEACSGSFCAYRDEYPWGEPW